MSERADVIYILTFDEMKAVWYSEGSGLLLYLGTETLHQNIILQCFPLSYTTTTRYVGIYPFH